jgi:hypothetical protein
MVQGVPGFVVKELGLVVAAPVGPVQHRSQLTDLRPQQRHKEAAHFGRAHLQGPAATADPSPRFFKRPPWRRGTGPGRSLAFPMFDALLLLPDPAFVLADLRMSVHTGIYISRIFWSPIC